MNFRSAFAFLFLMFVLLTGLIHSAYDPTTGTGGGGGNVFTMSNNTYTANVTNDFRTGPVHVSTFTVNTNTATWSSIFGSLTPDGRVTIRPLVSATLGNIAKTVSIVGTLGAGATPADLGITIYVQGGRGVAYTAEEIQYNTGAGIPFEIVDGSSVAGLRLSSSFDAFVTNHFGKLLNTETTAIYGKPVFISSNLVINGNTTIGSLSSDTITANASTMAIPNNLNIGSSALFISNAYGAGINVTSLDGNRFRVNTPTTAAPSAEALISSTASTNTPLFLQGIVGQTSPLLNIEDSAGVDLFQVAPNGRLTIFNSGYTLSASTSANSIGGAVVAGQHLRIYQGTTGMTNLFLSSIAGATVPMVVITTTNGANYININPEGSMFIGTNALSALPFRAILTGVATLNFASAIAGGQEDLPITVSGTSTNDVASLGVPFTAAAAGGAFTAYTSNNTVYVRFSNATAGVVDPASAQFRATVIRY